MSIHPTAIVEEGVQLGAGCVIHAHAIIKKHTRITKGYRRFDLRFTKGKTDEQRTDEAR